MWHPCRSCHAWVVSTAILLRICRLHLTTKLTCPWADKASMPLPQTEVGRVRVCARRQNKLRCVTHGNSWELVGTRVNSWNSWRKDYVMEPKYHSTHRVVREDMTCIGGRKWRSHKVIGSRHCMVHDGRSSRLRLKMEHSAEPCQNRFVADGYSEMHFTLDMSLLPAAIYFGPFSHISVYRREMGGSSVWHNLTASLSNHTVGLPVRSEI